jgi:hypothetical protein
MATSTSEVEESAQVTVQKQHVNLADNWEDREFCEKLAKEIQKFSGNITKFCTFPILYPKKAL